MLRPEEFSEPAMTVIVRSKKGNTTEVYSINRSHSYIETLVSAD